MLLLACALIGTVTPTTRLLGQTPYLVRDAQPMSVSSYPEGFTLLGNGTALFVAETQGLGEELWRSDGTSSGTTLVADICAGPCSSTPWWFTVVGGMALFRAHDRAGGVELWRSDGTAAGTYRVADIASGVASSSPAPIARHGTDVFFTADDGINGRELWRSNGSGAGTSMVADLCPGPCSPFEPAIGDSFASLAGELYFTAFAAASGRELWKTDGSAAGTRIVADACPGSCSSNPEWTIESGGSIYFLAQDATGSYGLWRSDGSAAGTQPLSAGLTNAWGLVAAGVSRLFFVGNDDAGEEVWTSDGTVPGTFRPAEHCPGVCGWVNELAVSGSRVFYGAGDDGGNSSLWSSDGSTVGTAPLHAFADDPCSWLGPEWLTAAAGTLLFAAGDPSTGRELWRSDGTSAGTVPVKDIYPGWPSSWPYGIAAGPIAGTVLLSASDGIGGDELWISDGTSAGTSPVADIDDTGTQGSGPAGLSRVSDRLYYAASDDPGDHEPWLSDGSSAGTRLIAKLGSGECGGVRADVGFVELDGLAHYLADDGLSGVELWRSDGSESGTGLVRDIQPGAGSGLSGNGGRTLVPWRGKLYFAADDGSSGRELWVSDGSAAGTLAVADIRPGPAGSGPDQLTATPEALYFMADDGVSGVELWRSDGTPAGTSRVADICPGSCPALPNFSGAEMAAVGDRVYLRASDGINGIELWRSDGSASGTAMVIDLSPGFVNSVPRNLVAVGSTLFFTAGFGSTEGLWRSDGSAAGTLRLADATIGALGLGVMAAAGEALYFASDQQGLGTELWRSDGTVAGTVLVSDIRPGSDGSGIQQLTAVGNEVLFAADDGVSGLELWRSDGSSGGTVQVADLAPGSAGSLCEENWAGCVPTELEAIGGRLFFRADDRSSGAELWALDLAAGATLLRNSDASRLDPLTPSRTALLPVAAVRDAYLAPFVAGGLDPETGLIGDSSRPLVLYALDGPGTLRLVKTAFSALQIFY